MIINSKELTKKIKISLKTMSRDNQDNKINRIFYQNQKLVSTDSFILTEIEMKMKNSFNFSIKEPYAKELLEKISKLNTDIKILKTKKGVNFNFMVNNKKETFKVTYNKNYETLDYEGITSNRYNNSLTFERKEVTELLKKRKKNNLLKDHPEAYHHMILVMKIKEKIDINFHNIETKKEELISFKPKKKINQQMGISKRYLNDVFKILKDKEITLEIDEYDSPFHFFTKDISVYIMPMDI